MFNLISLIKSNRTSMSSCVFSQHMGDSVLVLSCRMHMGCLTPLGSVDGAGDHALQTNVKSFPSGSSHVLPLFPTAEPLARLSATRFAHSYGFV